MNQLINKNKKATTVTAAVAYIKSNFMGLEMMKSSLTVTPTHAQAIAAEANRVIRTLTLSNPADRNAVESAIESLKAVAETTAPELAKTLNIRLIAIRNDIQVNQIEVAA